MATISKIQVCNSALIGLGANAITSFEDSSNEAQVCAAKFDFIRRDLLRLHPWNFATRRRLIAAEVLGPEYKYKYKFTIPAECVRLIQVYGNTDYRLEGRSILTNQVTESSPRVDIKYIADITDVSEWDSTFVNVFVFRLSMEIAYTLPGKETLIDRMMALYSDQLQKAKSIDGSEDINDQLDPSIPALIGSRYEW